jgi:chromosome segregation ATPase
VQAELTETSLSYRNSEEAAAAAQAKCASLQAELSATKSARDSLAQEQAHHKQMVTELDSKKDSLLQEIAALTQKHAHTESELSLKSEAQVQAEAVQQSNAASIDELKSELAAANAAISALKSEGSAVTQARQDELDRLREQLASQQGTLEATQQEVVALTGEKAGLELRATAHDELVPKFEAVQAELNRSVAACNELETSLSSRTSSLSELKTEHEAKVASIADLHAQLATSASTISALKSQNSTAEQGHQNELQRLSARLASEQQAREAARKEVLALSSDKAGLVTEKAGLAARANEAHMVLSELKDGHSALAAKHEKILAEKREAHRDALTQKQIEVDEVKAELKMTLGSRTELLGALSTVQDSLRESQAASEAGANAQRELQARLDAEQARTAALESELAAAKSEVTSAADEKTSVANARQEEIDRLVGQLGSMQTSLDRRQEVVHLLSQQVEYLLTMVPNAGSADDSSVTSQLAALATANAAGQARFPAGAGTGIEGGAEEGSSVVASPSQFGAGK